MPETTVFIKDASFLPDIVEIKANHTISFRNEDTFSYEIQCKNHATMHPKIVRTKSSCGYTFTKPGRYEISVSSFGGMKCVVEVREQDWENIPQRNVIRFPTAKDKVWLKARELLQSRVQSQSSDRTMADVATAGLDEFDSNRSHELQYSRQQEDAVDRLRREQLQWAKDSANSKKKPNKQKHARGGNDSDSSSSSSISSKSSTSSETDYSDDAAGYVRMRKRVKNRRQKESLHALRSSIDSSVSIEDPRTELETISTALANSSKATLRPSHRSSGNTAAPEGTVATETSTFLRSPGYKAHKEGTRRASGSAPSTPSSVSKRVAIFSDTPSVMVLIQDYEFSHKEIDLRLGQMLEFGLADDTPGHVEHELIGTTEDGQIKFESGLLHKGEGSVRYSYQPGCTGEIKVQCKIYPEMVCIAYVHSDVYEACSNSTGSLFRGKEKLKRKGIMGQQQQQQQQQRNNPMPSVFPLTERNARPSVTSTASSGSMLNVAAPLSIDIPAATSQTAVQTAAGITSIGTVASSSARHQVTAPRSLWGSFTPVTGIAQRIIDTAAGELSESQSSFYDSDDIFSDCDSIRSAGNGKAQLLQQQLYKYSPYAAAAAATLRGSFKNPVYPSNLANPLKSGIVSHKPVTNTNPMSKVTSAAPFNKISSVALNEDDETYDGMDEQEDDSGDEVDFLDDDLHDVKTVHIDDYHFRPSNLIISCGQKVRFLRKSSGPAVCLACEGEFSLDAVKHHKINYLHTFTTAGSYDVKNEVYSFMVCHVLVSSHSSGSNSSNCSGSSRASVASSRSSKQLYHEQQGAVNANGVPPLQGSFSLPTATPETLPKHMQNAAGNTCSSSGMCSTVTTTVNATSITTSISTISSTTNGNDLYAQHVYTPAIPPVGTPAQKLPSESVPGSSNNNYTADALAHTAPALFGSFGIPVGTASATILASADFVTWDDEGDFDDNAATAAAEDDDEDNEAGNMVGDGKTSKQRKKAKQRKKYRQKKKMMLVGSGEAQLPDDAMSSVIEATEEAEVSPAIDRATNSTHRISTLNAQADWVEEFDSEDEGEVVVDNTRKADDDDDDDDEDASPETTAGANMRNGCQHQLEKEVEAQMLSHSSADEISAANTLADEAPSSTHRHHVHTDSKASSAAAIPHGSECCVNDTAESVEMDSIPAGIEELPADNVDVVSHKRASGKQLNNAGVTTTEAQQTDLAHATDMPVNSSPMTPGPAPAPAQQLPSSINDTPKQSSAVGYTPRTAGAWTVGYGSSSHVKSSLLRSTLGVHGSSQASDDSIGPVTEDRLSNSNSRNNNYSTPVKYTEEVGTREADATVLAVDVTQLRQYEHAVETLLLRRLLEVENTYRRGKLDILPDGRTVPVIRYEDLIQHMVQDEQQSHSLVANSAQQQQQQGKPQRPIDKQHFPKARNKRAVFNGKSRGGDATAVADNNHDSDLVTSRPRRSKSIADSSASHSTPSSKSNSASSSSQVNSQPPRKQRSRSGSKHNSQQKSTAH